MRRIYCGQVPSGSRWLPLARILFALLCLLSASGSTAVVLFARTAGLLQSRLRQVSYFWWKWLSHSDKVSNGRERTGNALLSINNCEYLHLNMRIG